MTSNHLRKLVTAALMAAMTCITTMVIPIPSPTGGYAHPGDGFVLLSGIILGPVYGAFAAGIGSMLADLFLGYSVYFLATFIIKGLAAAIAAITYLHIKKARTIFAGIFGGIIVTAGYLVFEIFLLGFGGYNVNSTDKQIFDNLLFGFGAAVTNIPLNLVQNIIGIILSTALHPLLRKVPQIKDLMNGR